MTHAGQLTSESPTSLSYHPAPGQVLRFTGEVDLATADSLHGQFLEHLRLSAETVVGIDLSAVSFMDCAGHRPSRAG
ncbi:MAG: STAS domain-containing protein [Actinomycetia bacterium]|nr:STAS domain-containing protein [Actinomycetes bacterium]